MKPLFLFNFLSLLLLSTSCTTEYKGKSPGELFDSMSKKDSIVLVNEIIDSLRMEAYSSEYYDHRFDGACLYIPDGNNYVLRIKVYDSGQYLVQGEITTKSITKNVFEYFTMNFELPRDQSYDAYMNPKNARYNYPFYDELTLYKINKEVIRSKENLEKVRNAPKPYQDLIDFKQKQYELWKEKQDLFNAVGLKSARESYFARVSIDYPDSIDQITYVDDILHGYLLIRDYLSQLYFGQSYTELFFRHKFDNDKLALNRIIFIKSIRPIKILDYPYCEEHNTCHGYMPVPPPPPMPSNF